MDSRILAISRHDMWPGITPLNVYELPLSMWLALAVSCDEEVEERRRQIRRMERGGR